MTCALGKSRTGGAGDVIVAFPKEADARTIKNILVKSGFSVMGTAATGSDALSQAEDLNGGILISAYQFEDMVYSELREDLGPEFSMLLICNPSRLAEPPAENVIFLPLPLRVNDLVHTVDMMSTDILERRRKRKSRPPVRSAADMETISRAKTLLMERNGMSEEEAHRYLQKCSMENGCNLTETAQMVISLNS